MLSWVVKKMETAEAILAATRKGDCCTVDQINAIAAAHGDTVSWLAPVPSVDLSRDCKA